MDHQSQVVAVGQAKGGQKRDRVAANLTQEALNQDQEGFLVVAYVARVTTVAHKSLDGAAVGTETGLGEGKFGKLAGVGLDIEVEVCNNNHVLVRAPGVETLPAKTAFAPGPSSFLQK